ncbi:neuroligin-4, Y-linked [Folsomia candida]|uniref:neuroligin-4, Y-linked n=1 Tax=Folsomia candida TaxID=158441 RepID=UPI001604ECC5|nr:neuroligin-4, Y-linked [Folsomia candida]
MRGILILLSVITINCQNVNENSTTSHFLPEPAGLSSSSSSGGGGRRSADDTDYDHQDPEVGEVDDILLGEGKGSPFESGRNGGTESSTTTTTTTTTTRSRIVETKYGKLQGMSITIGAQGRHNPLKNKIVEVYVGIPYASAPIKSHRFGPTQTAMPWEGVRDAVKPGFVCPQMMPDIRNESAALKEMPRGYLEYLKKVEPYLRNQSEDCLYLNIYSPIGPEPKVRPVLVYIHGGKFSWGSGNLSDGTILAAYGDVIFVSLNYRLNVLGFLNVHAIPNGKPRVANYGLMDQIAALHWIKENILKFGGDPENITLIGYEAGAACIHYLMASPAVTPGLFHRSVLIAGSAHAPWALVSDPSASAAALAQALNCSIPSKNATGNPSPPVPTPAYQPSSRGDSKQFKEDPIFECVKNKHFSEFVGFSPPKFGVDFGPSIDGVVIKPNFRASSESQMGKRDVAKKYDVLFGLSSLEKMTAFSETDLQSGFEGGRRDAILRTLIRNSYRFHLNEILATISNEYTDWEKSSQHPVAMRDLTVSAVTDCLALAPVIAVSESGQVNRGFFYVFEHATKDGLYNYFSSQGQRTGGVGGEELSYMFGTPLVELLTGQLLPFVPPPIPSNYTKTEMALSELFITFLSNFAHSGDPNEPLKGDFIWPVSKERNRYKNTPWEGHDRLHQRYLEISANKVRTRSHYRAHQMAIWLRLIPELQRSGAQFASGLHNRIKGGNDPSLYVGKLRYPLDGDDPLLLQTPSILDMLGYRGSGYLDGMESGQEENSLNLPAHPSSPPTPCFSSLPASSSSSSSPSMGGVEGFNFTGVPESSSFFAPYSTALSVTIAIGCSLLILNVFIFTIIYYQRDKRSSEMAKSTSTSTSDSHHHQNCSSSKIYGEPPELLKSNSTTCTSLHHGYGGVSSPTGGPGGRDNGFGSPPQRSLGGQQQPTSQQQQQHMEALAQRGILLSPSQAGHPCQHGMYQMGAAPGFATLPRSNNGGISNLPKPPPPPRTCGNNTTNFSTLPHNATSLRESGYSCNFDELKV